MGQIRQLMTIPPRTVKAGDSVVEAAKLMRAEETSIAPVVHDGRLVGVVTDHDIAVRVVAEGRDPSATKVEEIASLDLVTVDPEQGLEDALELMKQHRVHRLPVVEEDGRVVGVVSRNDVARHAGRDEIAEQAQFSR